MSGLPLAGTKVAHFSALSPGPFTTAALREPGFAQEDVKRLLGSAAAAR